MSIGLLGRWGKRRVTVCDECGEDILGPRYAGWIKGLLWDLHKECFEAKEVEMACKGVLGDVAERERR